MNYDNSLWFMEETCDITECKEGSLADQIFNLVDEKISKEKKEIISSIIQNSPKVAELVEGMTKTQHLKLVFSDDIKAKLANNTYKLMKKKDMDGVFKAVVVDSRGRIKAIAGIKLEEIRKGVEFERVTASMQDMTVQQQLKEVSEQLDEISASLEDILAGQHNDRLALFYSGEAIYKEALVTTDPDRKKQLSSAAILSLTNAIASLQTNLAFEINDICEKYDETKRKFIGIKSENIRNKMFLINSSFQTIHKAVTLKTAIYYQEGEYNALITVLSDYKSFLERSLTDRNTHILYLADPNEKDIDGIWNIRQNELPFKIEKTKKALKKKSDYALDIKKGDIQ